MQDSYEFMIPNGIYAHFVLIYKLGLTSLNLIEKMVMSSQLRPNSNKYRFNECFSFYKLQLLY